MWTSKNTSSPSFVPQALKNVSQILWEEEHLFLLQPLPTSVGLGQLGHKYTSNKGCHLTREWRNTVHLFHVWHFYKCYLTSWWASQVVLKVMNLAANAGDVAWILGSGGSPGGGHGYPLRYSCLENPMERGACWAMVHGIAELDMTEET